MTLAVSWADADGFSGHRRGNFHDTAIAVPAVSEESLFQLRQVQLPGWVTRIPENCFVGISLPSNSIQEARAGALDSAVSGITLRKHFDKPYVKPLIISVALIMTFGVFNNRWMLTRVFEGWGIVGMGLGRE